MGNYAREGLMVDLSDLWETGGSDIAEGISSVSQLDGTYYMYPLSVAAHCMAINYEAFKAAGALQYILCSGSCRTDDRRRGDKRFNRDETEDRQKIKCYCSLRAQQHASRCTDMEHSAPYRAGCLGIFMPSA